MLYILGVSQLRDECDVRVHIEQTGICGSDVHLKQHGRIGDFAFTSPIVKNVKVGDLVAIEPDVSCRKCEYCRSGAYSSCAETIFAATTPDFCYPLPIHFNSEDGAIVELVAVAVQICKVAELRAGPTVLVFGCDPIGAIGVDISESRAKFALSFGTDGVAGQILDEFDLGGGVDAVRECTGAEPCIQACVLATRKGGTRLVACIRALNIKGSIGYTTGCFPSAIDLIAGGKINSPALKAFKLVKNGQANTMKGLIQGVE
ncbi:GroES-like protein [Annulohypoxylon bovei var. microspora]|nr:GroES-like protein [Annulohypoxylon bovei var. microspora]